jgi:2-iminobutanoate/2-iminopropanoate deaminase
MRNVVCTGDAPNAIGPYSQAVKGGGFIFVSGQLALNPATQQIIEGDARQQTQRALQNIAAILKASGSNLDKVVRCGVFLKNMSDLEAMLPPTKLLASNFRTQTTIEPIRPALRLTPLWFCPKCGGPMVVLERLTAAQLQLRSPAGLAGAAKGDLAVGQRNTSRSRASAFGREHRSRWTTRFAWCGVTSSITTTSA